MIKIKAMGASHEVGRSAFLVHYKHSNILLDYGLKIEPTGIEYPLKPDVKVQSIALSHAHLDHSGMIPAIFKDSNPLVYLTAPTLDISNILWEDTIKIAQHDNSPLVFDKGDVRKTNNNVQVMSYRQEAKITPEIDIEMFDAGHILGSAMIKLRFGDKNLLYTGDYKMEETRLHKGADLDVGDINYLMVESTYGDRDHKPRDKVEKEFIEHVRATLENGGSVLIPAFAVGRAQEIIDILAEYKMDDYPIYLDGMGQKVANIYMKYPGFYKNPYELRQSLSKAIWVQNQRMRKKIVKEQSIVVTTAGMLEGGPILYYLKKKYNDPKTSIYMTGFQVEETKGAILLENNSIEIENQVYKVKGEIKKFDFSAHIGRKYLMKSISYWNPEKVIAVHGDEKVIDKFVEDIETELGIKATAPYLGDVLKLD